MLKLSFSQLSWRDAAAPFIAAALQQRLGEDDSLRPSLDEDASDYLQDPAGDRDTSAYVMPQFLACGEGRL